MSWPVQVEKDIWTALAHFPWATSTGEEASRFKGGHWDACLFRDFPKDAYSVVMDPYGSLQQAYFAGNSML